ncbi:hypothetical protein SK128_017263 [Halocaridina rubra]|uniref:Uncharacterized protein n=1 Tax=Halocaridina rubra TaxID=373956 RepID=A0AAN8X0A7_HALRR
MEEQDCLEIICNNSILHAVFTLQLDFEIIKQLTNIYGKKIKAELLCKTMAADIDQIHEINNINDTALKSIKNSCERFGTHAINHNIKTSDRNHPREGEYATYLDGRENLIMHSLKPLDRADDG